MKRILAVLLWKAFVYCLTHTNWNFYRHKGIPDSVVHTAYETVYCHNNDKYTSLNDGVHKSSGTAWFDLLYNNSKAVRIVKSRAGTL